MNSVEADDHKIILTNEEDPDCELTVIKGQNNCYLEIENMGGSVEQWKSCGMVLTKTQLLALADWIRETFK